MWLAVSRVWLVPSRVAGSLPCVAGLSRVCGWAGFGLACVSLSRVWLAVSRVWLASLACERRQPPLCVAGGWQMSLSRVWLAVWCLPLVCLSLVYVREPGCLTSTARKRLALSHGAADPLSKFFRQFEHFPFLGPLTTSANKRKRRNPHSRIAPKFLPKISQGPVVGPISRSRSSAERTSH